MNWMAIQTLSKYVMPLIRILTHHYNCSFQKNTYSTIEAWILHIVLLDPLSKVKSMERYNYQILRRWVERNLYISIMLNLLIWLMKLLIKILYYTLIYNYYYSKPCQLLLSFTENIKMTFFPDCINIKIFWMLIAIAHDSINA